MDQEDALFARLLTMGFDMGDVQKCYEALSSTSTPFNLQKATEWLLDKASEPPKGAKPSSNTLVLTPPTGHTPSTSHMSSFTGHTPSTDHTSSTGHTPAAEHIPDVQKPISSSTDFSAGGTTSEEPLASRYNLGSAHARDKERFAQKEREEAVRKAKERRRGDFLAKEQLRKQIQEDRKAREVRTGKATPTTSDSTTPTTSLAQKSDTDKATPIPVTGGRGHDSTTCRVQVRLPSGRVLRRVFPSSAILDDVIGFVVSNEKQLAQSTVTLVQPFPRHEYTPEEGQSSLEALGMCPSASLVVSISSVNKERGVAVAKQPVPVPMDTGDGGVAGDGPDSHSNSDESDSDTDDGSMPPPGIFGPPRGNYIRPGGAGVQPPGNLRPHVNFGPPRHRGHGFQNPFLPGGFGGGGHRLGGKEEVAVAGDIGRRSERTRLAAKAAALQRESHPAPAQPHPSHVLPSHAPSLPTLEALCVRVLVAHSNKYGMPSCAAVPPRIAQGLLAALKQEKKLNSKTLMAFYKCPIAMINLDNYLFVTGEFLSSLSHFPQLTDLSLCSCPIITDRAMTELLPYLPSLSCLRLNGCSQLTEAIFRALRGCKELEVLELSQVKVTDDGLRLLLYYSLQHLKELDLSCTQVTSTGLRLLPAGTPLLERLSIESTQINDYTPLPSLPHLRSLSLAHCPAPSERALGVLGACHELEVLNLAGVELEGSCLEGLAGLSLTSLKLPDRNLCFDVTMEPIARFPLTSLDLTDYLHITDVGVACLVSMTSLTSLSLSRTKLTDAGMPFLQGLTGLKELCLDNTLITDIGIAHVAGLVELEQLSLSDTGVTSQFILDGVLSRLSSLSKLNLSRTAVCDRGILVLRLPSLAMLNLDWTCITEAVSIPALSDCPVLETLRNRNICQPLPARVAARVQRSRSSQGSDDDMDL